MTLVHYMCECGAETEPARLFSPAAGRMPEGWHVLPNPGHVDEHHMCPGCAESLVSPSPRRARRRIVRRRLVDEAGS